MCSYQGKCKTLTDVDPSYDVKGLGIAVKWCDYHSKLYRKQSEIIQSMVEEYNKKQIKNRFGKVIRFSHHSDVSNYLFLHDKSKLKEIEKQAMVLIQ